MRARVDAAMGTSEMRSMASVILLIPLIFVVIAVLAFNFLGDGIRDAADPYK